MQDYASRTDIGDYDFRYPLHLAAAEGRILAVIFLLGVSADPNCSDRWGNTPMDDAYRGGTLFHLYCSKLIQEWGGELGPQSAAIKEGQDFLKELEAICIKHVRLLIKRLIDKSYDKIDPINMTEDEVSVSLGTTISQLPVVQALQTEGNDLTNEVKECSVLIGDICNELKTNTKRLLNLLKYGSTESDASADSTPNLNESNKTNTPPEMSSINAGIVAVNAQNSNEASEKAYVDVLSMPSEKGIVHPLAMDGLLKASYSTVPQASAFEAPLDSLNPDESRPSTSMSEGAQEHYLLVTGSNFRSNDKSPQHSRAWPDSNFGNAQAHEVPDAVEDHVTSREKGLQHGDDSDDKFSHVESVGLMQS